MALLVAAVLLMLLLASANVAGLVMIGADARRQDMAVRAALGASRGRLVRQLAVEHGVLALAGGVAGLGLAAAGVRAVAALRPGDPAARRRPRARLGRAGRCWPAPPRWPAWPAALLPVLRLSRRQRVEPRRRHPRQRRAARGSAPARRWSWLQVTASVMLLLGATLLVAHARGTAAGGPRSVAPKGVLTAEVQLPAAHLSRRRPTSSRFYRTCHRSAWPRCRA